MKPTDDQIPKKTQKTEQIQTWENEGGLVDGKVYKIQHLPITLTRRVRLYLLRKWKAKKHGPTI